MQSTYACIFDSTSLSFAKASLSLLDMNRWYTRLKLRGLAHSKAAAWEPPQLGG